MNYREAEQLKSILGITCVILCAMCFTTVRHSAADVDNTPVSNVDTANPKTIESGKTTPGKTPTETPTSESKVDPLSDLPSYGEALIRMVVVLASILIALLILAKLLPRWLNRSLGHKSKGDIAVVDSIQLEPRRRVYLLRVSGREVLVGSSEQGLHTLVGELSNGQKNGTPDADGADAVVIQPGHQPSSLATPFESVMKSKDGSTSPLREND